MAVAAIFFVVIIVGGLLALIISAMRTPNVPTTPQQKQPPSTNSSGLFAEPSTTGASRAGAARKAQLAPMPTTSGTGRTLTYLLQAHIPNQGWVTGQKSTGQLSAFGTITATDDELPGFAKAVIQRFDNGTRTMRIVFFRGDVPFSELSIEKAYGDVTPKQSGGFSPWIFAG